MRRRTLVLSLALAAAWITPVLSPPTNAPPPASARSLSVEQWEPTGARTTAAVDWRESVPMPAGDAVLVGADWGGAPGVDVQVRARDQQGWGDWLDLSISDEHVPDPSSREATAIDATASDPVWIGRSEDIQFRVRGGAPSLTAHLVDEAGDLSYDPGAVPPGAALAATDQPLIRPRASWGADESLRDGRIDYADNVRFSIVHHVQRGGIWDPDDIANGCTTAAAKINGIYEYHVKVRGFWDIAYNFVVDPCGGIWEGRYGGIEKAVVGAHAAGFNSGSVGVLALGAFEPSSTRPADPVTDDMVAGIEELLAWKLDVHHVDPTGTTDEVSGCSPGSCSSRYPDGTHVELPVLSAHQIQNSTECPGSELMARLFDGLGPDATPDPAYVDAVAQLGTPKAFGGPPATWEADHTGDRPEWDVRFSEPVDWSLRIRDENGDIVRSTGDQDATTASRIWDLRDADGHMVDAGQYTAELSASGASGAIRPVVTDLTVSPGVTRRAGEDRIGTAVALSEGTFDTADTVVLASALAYPDALVASPLAGSYGGPVLLTWPDDLPGDVADEIDRLGASHVIITGGATAVSRDVTTELEGLDVTVERLAGPDRFATAAAVARRVADREGSTEVLLALGAHDDPSRAFPDALSAGAFGAIEGLPVVLTAPTALPNATATALTDLAPRDVRIFGGVAAIPAAVESQVQRVLPGASLARFAGADRFETARLAAEDVLVRRGEPIALPVTEDTTASPSPSPSPTATASPSPSPTDSPSPTATASPSPSSTPTEPAAPPIRLVLASGLNWPDALGAGAVAAATDSLFLMLAHDELGQAGATEAFLDANDGRIEGATVAGGPAAVSRSVVDALTGYVLAAAETEPESWTADPNPVVEPSPSPSGSVSTMASPSPSSSSSPTGTASPSPSPTSTASPTTSPSPTTSDSPSPSPSTT